MEIIKYLVFIILIPISFVLSCTEKDSKPKFFSSYISVVSAKGYGVILHNPPFAFGENANMSRWFPTQELKDEYENNGIVKIYPQILPGAAYQGMTAYPGFKNDTNNLLPDEVTLEYEYADISECRSEYSAHPWSHGTSGRKEDTSITLIAKNWCDTWKPIENMRFKRTIDLRPFHDSIEFQRAGKKIETLAKGKYGLAIDIRFFDNGKYEISMLNLQLGTVW